MFVSFNMFYRGRPDRNNAELTGRFVEEVDRILKENDPSPILAVRVANFVAAFKLAGERVVGKTKPKKRNRVWMNAHIRAIIRKRNKLRKHFGTKREEWKAACQEVT